MERRYVGKKKHSDKINAAADCYYGGWAVLEGCSIDLTLHALTRREKLHAERVPVAQSDTIGLLQRSEEHHSVFNPRLKQLQLALRHQNCPKLEESILSQRPESELKLEKGLG